MLFHKGWYYDEYFTEPANIGDEIPNDIILYAKWEDGLGGLTFTADSEPIFIYMRTEGEPAPISLEYTLDGANWQDFDIKGREIITVEPYQSVAFRGDNATFSRDFWNCYQFIVEGGCAHLSGNVMYLVDKTGEKREIDNNYQFAYLLSGWHGHWYDPELPTPPDPGTDANKFISISADLLPATTLKPYCYNYMFAHTGSTDKFIGFPDNFLHVTDLSTAPHCYDNMFSDTQWVKEIPSNFLPATIVGDYCYSNMFSKSSVTHICENAILADTLMDYACVGMFTRSAIASVDSGFCHPVVLEERAMDSMFEYCEYLTNVGSNIFNNATNVGRNALQFMFAYCPNLTKVPSDLLTFENMNAVTGDAALANMFLASGLVDAPTLNFNCLEPNICVSIFQDAHVSKLRIASNVTQWARNALWLSSVNIDRGDVYCPKILVDSGQLPLEDFEGVPMGWYVHYI